MKLSSLLSILIVSFASIPPRYQQFLFGPTNSIHQGNALRLSIVFLEFSFFGQIFIINNCHHERE
jgi:hypothetical protein